MESPNLVKVVAAFVVGVVIALGSALIYVRVSEMVHPEPIAMAQTDNEPAQPISNPPVIQTPPVSVPAPAPTAQPVSRPPVIQQAKKQQPSAKPVPMPYRPAESNVTHARLTAIRWPAHPRVTYASTPVEAPPAPADDPPSPVPDQAQPHVVTLEAGTQLPIRLSESLSTDRNYIGDTFRGTLDAPIIRGGFIIADKGSKVLGRIINSEKSLTITLTEINTTDGQRVQVETSSLEQRNGATASASEDAAKIAGGAALGAIIGAAAGGGKGAAIGAGIGGAAGTGVVLVGRTRPATLPVESRLAFRLLTPLTLTEKLN